MNTLQMQSLKCEGMLFYFTKEKSLDCFIQDDMYNLLIKIKIKHEIEKGKFIIAKVKEKLSKLVSIAEVNRIFMLNNKTICD